MRWDRSSEHRQALRTGDTSNPLVKHMELNNLEEEPDFLWKVDKAHKTSLSRQIRESTLIQQENPLTNMNSKSEWSATNTISRVII